MEPKRYHILILTIVSATLCLPHANRERVVYFRFERPGRRGGFRRIPYVANLSDGSIGKHDAATGAAVNPSLITRLTHPGDDRPKLTRKRQKRSFEGRKKFQGPPETAA